MVFLCCFNFLFRIAIRGQVRVLVKNNYPPREAFLGFQYFVQASKGFLLRTAKSTISILHLIHCHIEKRHCIFFVLPNLTVKMRDTLENFELRPFGINKQ